MRKGTYRSNPNKEVVVVITVSQDMTDDEFGYFLERAMGEPLVDPELIINQLRNEV